MYFFKVCMYVCSLYTYIQGIIVKLRSNSPLMYFSLTTSNCLLIVKTTLNAIKQVKKLFYTANT